MTVEQFITEYANTPIDKRFEPIDVIKYGDLTLGKIYREIKKLEDEMRPKRIRQDKLLNIAEKFLYFKERK